MTVEFIPKNRSCVEIALPNQTWFDLLRFSDIGNVFGRIYANDPITATAEQARQCAAILSAWQPPETWGVGLLFPQETCQRLLIEFFNTCEGFKILWRA